MQWFNTFNFAYLQVIYNHTDYVSHYFRKIWPLYADDIISILLSFFWNRFLAICDGESCPDWLILIVCSCNALSMHYELSAGVTLVRLLFYGWWPVRLGTASHQPAVE